MPFGARIDELEKMRKRRKKQIKDQTATDGEAFNFFFHKKSPIPQPRVPEPKAQTNSPLKRGQTERRGSFEKIGSKTKLVPHFNK